MTQEFKKVDRKTKAMIRLFNVYGMKDLEDMYERFCDIVFPHGAIIKGCQYVPTIDGEETRYTMCIYYEVEKERAEIVKKELKDSEL